MIALVISMLMLDHPGPGLRVMTYNASLYRDREGQLAEELSTKTSQQAIKVASIIQYLNPDVLLLNEFDHDGEGRALKGFMKNYLEVGQSGLKGVVYRFTVNPSVNTGVPSGLDQNQNGTHGEPQDAYGYGRFPGQYGMVILSKIPIAERAIRSFQTFLWHDMPAAERPVDPSHGRPFHPDSVWQALRLSSKTVLDVPLKWDQTVVHFVTAHPTPPIFDGPEDLNGCRNHDEIRMLADLVAGRADYLYDDRGQKGGLPPDAHFVIAGDLNADPFEGASRNRAIHQLLSLPVVQANPVPISTGALALAAAKSADERRKEGDPAADTAQFNGNNSLRVDYVLPSQSLTIKQIFVFWPSADEVEADWITASDHRPVVLDLISKKGAPGHEGAGAGEE